MHAWVAGNREEPANLERDNAIPKTVALAAAVRQSYFA